MLIVYVSSQLNWWCWWWNTRDDNDGDDDCGDDDDGVDDDDDANEMNVLMLLLVIMLLMIMMMMSKTWILLNKILFEILAKISKSIYFDKDVWCVMYFLIEYCVLQGFKLICESKRIARAPDPGVFADPSSMIIVHACTMIIVHACTMIIVHAYTMIIVHTYTMIIVHAYTVIIVHANTFSSREGIDVWGYCSPEGYEGKNSRAFLLPNNSQFFIWLGGVRSDPPLPNKKPVFYLGEGGCSVEGALEPPPICVCSTGQPPSPK